MSNPLNVLIVEDSESDAALIARLLHKAGYDVRDERVETAGQMRTALERPAWDVVIADYHLPQFDAPAALALLQQTGLDIPFLIVSGAVGEDTAVAMMKAGAHDYLMKDKLLRLAPAVERELREAETRRERKRAEQAQRESEERYRDLVENTHDLLCTHDLEGRILSVNRAATDLTGYAAGDLIGANLRDFLTPETRQDFDAYLAAVQQDGVARGLMQVQTKSGEKRIWEYHNTLRTQGLAAPIVRGYARDITEQRRAEKALRESERKLKAAQAIGRIGSWEFDVQGQRITWSDQTYRLYERDPASGPPTAEEEATYYSPEQALVLQEYARRALEEGANFEYDLEIKLPSGRRVYGAAKMQPVKDAQGRVIRLAGTIQDITERKRMEDALRRAEEKYRSIFENALEGIYQSTPEGRFTTANPALARMWGYESPQELIASITDIAQQVYIDPDRCADVQRALEEQAEVQQAEFQTRRKDGSTMWVSENMRAVRDAHGALLYYEGTFEDITERKRAEEAIQSLARFPSENPNPVLRIGRDGVLLYANEASDALLRDWQLEIGKPAPSVLQEAVSDVLARQTEISIDTQHDQRIISFFVAPVVEAGYANLYGRDVTERKRAEDALAQERNLLRTLIDSLPDYVYVKDTGSRYVLSNTAHARFLGAAAPDDITGKTVFDLYPQELAPGYYADDQTVIRSGQPMLYHDELSVDSAGNKRWLSTTKVPLRDRQGKVIGLVGVSRDITKRKQAEEALRVSEERFALAVRGSNDGLWDWDIRGKTLYWSPRLKELLGYADDELQIDFDVFDTLLHPDDKARVAAALEAHLKGRAPYDVEERQRTKLGEYRWYQARGQALWDEAGNPIRMVGFTSDITERKRAEARIIHLNEVLRAVRNVNQLITRERDLQRLMSDACAILVQTRGYRMAWVGLIKEGHQRVIPAAHAGQGTDFLDHVTITWDESETGQGPTGAAIRTRRPAGCRNVAIDPRYTPWREAALAHGFGSTAVVPMVYGERLFGTVSVYADQPEAFDEEEIDLLSELADDLAFALQSIEDEAERKRAEEAMARRAEEMAALNELGQRLTARLDTAGVMQEAYRGATRLLDTANFYIALYNKDKDEISFPLDMSDGQRVEDDMTLSSSQGMTGYVIRNREPVLITGGATQWRAERGIESTGSQLGSQSWLGVPMIVGDQVLGVLTVRNYAVPHAFDEHDRDLLAALANQTAIALQNARLFEETRVRAEELAVLNELSQSFTSRLSIEGVLQETFRGVSRLVDAANFYVSLYDPGKNEVTFPLQVVDGKRVEPEHAAPANLGFTGYLIRTRAPLLLRDKHPGVEEARLGVQDVQFAGRLESKCWLGVPMLVGDQALGTATVLSYTDPYAFDEHDRELLVAIANQMAIALQNAYLFEQAQARAQHLATLNEISQAITSTLDLDSVLTTLLEHARNAVNVEACSVALADSETGDLVFRQAVGAVSQAVIGLHLKFGQGIVGWVAEHWQPTLVPDALSDPRFDGKIDSGTGFVTRDVACAPLVIHDAVIGVIELINKRQGVFDPEDLRLLQSIAAQAAIAIENAELFETQRMERQRLEMLYRTGQTLNSTRDTSAILDRLTEEAMRATRATHGSALVARPDLNCFERRSLRGYSPDEVARARDIPLPLDRGINSRAYNTRQIVRVDDVQTDPEYFSLIPTTRAELVVPILRGGQALGNLDLQSPQAGAFRNVNLGFLQALTDQVAVALESARLFEAARRRLDEMSVISNVALVGAAGRPFDETVARATDALSRLWPDMPLGFLFVDEAGESLRPHASYHSLLPETIGSLRIPWGQGITGWAMQERRPIRVGDASANPHFWDDGAKTRSEMVAPLVVGERVIGVVNVESSLSDAFSGDDLRLLTTLAGQLATIFEKARLDAALEAERASLAQRVEERTAELRAANEQLRQAHEQVSHALEKEKELGELKSRFVSMTSHEFRTPLTTILSSSELLEHYGSKWAEDKRLQHLHRIQAAVGNMVQLLDDVLIIGRAEAGKLEFNPAPLNLEQFCCDLVEEMQLIAGPQHKITFASHGECAGACMDEKLLRQILSNLLSNAAKYSPPGSPVYFNLTCREGKAVLQIRDEGIGIPPQDQAHLFETFHRARNVGNVPGTGLGLTIVKKSVDLHRGAVTFESQVGVGTTFTVTLPTRNGE